MRVLIAYLKIKSFRLSIRSKLLLVSAVLFVVPWIGVKYIQDMEVFLRENQQENLLGKAQIVAAVLQGQVDIFKSRSLSNENTLTPININESTSHLYVRPLKRAIQLDGYLDDWLFYDEKSKLISSSDPDSLEYRYYLASYKKYLYVMLEIKDDQVIYRKNNRVSLLKNDHIILKLRDKQGQLKTYFIATQSPGWVTAQRMELRNKEWKSVAPELRIKGEWQETKLGYNVEIRLPLALIGDGFSFFVADVDDAHKEGVKLVLGESKFSDAPGSIIIPSLNVEEMLTRIIRPASRTWVIDNQYRVLAVAGDLRDFSGISNEERENKLSILSKVASIFYYLLLKQPAYDFKDELSSVSFFRSKVVQTALNGQPSTSWRISPDKQVRILTASYPVMLEGNPVGAIAIEETSNAILILQNRAMEILINLSMLTFLITLVVLLGYATRLSVRIRCLRDQTEHAISSEGRIKSSLKQNHSTDEIGDLARSFSGMLLRLGEYNRYLETMAGKLSHELRTPIAVTRSSLENLKSADSDADREIYIQRANEGLSRLSNILTRMSEATRLEQTLESETIQAINLSELIAGCVAGYQQAYSEVIIDFENNTTEPSAILGVSELFAQMLDKLIANAVDFHSDKKFVKLCVINQGEALPQAMRDNLFESMVSVRSRKNNQSHLGLGLYIVRLIVKFHQGEVCANNLSDGSGVIFQLSFPLI